MDVFVTNIIQYVIQISLQTAFHGIFHFINMKYLDHEKWPYFQRNQSKFISVQEEVLKGVGPGLGYPESQQKEAEYYENMGAEFFL
jgi:hypothetical protein